MFKVEKFVPEAPKEEIVVKPGLYYFLHMEKDEAGEDKRKYIRFLIKKSTYEYTSVEINSKDVVIVHRNEEYAPNHMMFECFNCINVTEVSEDEFLKAIISGESRLHDLIIKLTPVPTF
jgi:hypothetical protein